MALGIGIGIGVTLGGGNATSAAFSPASLFASGEQGGWYDPSDLTTMYKESTGLTPVAIASDPVGLILDKKNGLIRGPELVVNGDGSSVVGWTVTGGATLASVGGEIEVTGAGGALPTGRPPLVTTVIGNWYEVTGTIHQGTTASGVLIAIVTPATNSATVSTTTPTAVRFIFQATTTSTTIQCRINSGTGTGTAYFKNVSCKQIDGVLQSPALQATTTARPLYQTSFSRVVYDGVDDILNITFPVVLGPNCTIGRSVPGVGASILTGQNLGSSVSDNTNFCGLVIVNRALTGPETASLTTYLNAKAGF